MVKTHFSIFLRIFSIVLGNAAVLLSADSPKSKIVHHNHTSIKMNEFKLYFMFLLFFCLQILHLKKTNYSKSESSWVMSWFFVDWTWFKNVLHILLFLQTALQIHNFWGCIPVYERTLLWYYFWWYSSLKHTSNCLSVLVIV